jgi:hypothetical protein
VNKTTADIIREREAAVSTARLAQDPERHLQSLEDLAEIAQPHAFVTAGAGFAGDGQGLLVVLDRLLGLPQGQVAVAEAAQPPAFAAAVAGFAGDGQGLLVVVDRLLGLP